jgi:peptide/nickel transport system ATP-binding protein
MSAPGRPEGEEHRSAQHEGTPVSATGRPEGESRSAQREGDPASGPGHDLAHKGPPQTIASTPLLELRGIDVEFARPMTLRSVADWARGSASTPQPRPVRALDNVDLQVHGGEIVGLVGESGCGKSTLGRVAVGLQRPTAGERRLHGRPLVPGGPRREAVAQQLKLQMIFQDPYASLNPRLRVNEIVGEAPVTHGLVPRAEREAFVAGLLAQVGLAPEMARRYPHQFSGGQRARIGIARALAVRPEFIVCDEAVAALDVSVQGQVLNLFADLRERLGLSYLFISHNLAVVHHIADRVVVMYLGRVVESAPAPTLFGTAAHPYTQALLAELPTLKVQKKKFVAIRGEIPSPMSPPSGCHFHPRCPHAFERCRQEVPALLEVAPGHHAACHLHAPA